jgi:hypothetical protein
MSELNDEIQNDLNEAELQEPKPSPGRPRGQKERSTAKRQVRLRVRAFRERQREKLEAEEEARISQEQLFKDMRAEGLLFFGEIAPTVNSNSIQDEIEMARIWARLLKVREIQPGEDQKAYILEVMKAWCGADCPLLHLESRTLSKRKVDLPEIEAYIWPDGADTPFQPEQAQPIAVPEITT